MSEFNVLVQQVIEQVKAQFPAWGEALKKWAVGRAQEEVRATIDLLKSGNTVAGLQPIAPFLSPEGFEAWVAMLRAKMIADTDAAAGHYDAQVKALEIVAGFVLTLLVSLV